MRRFLLAFILLFTMPLTATAVEDKSVAIGDGIVLHYVEQGQGPTVIFVHGSTSDYSYWQKQIAPFAAHYQVIAYSRRYNPPNTNPPRPGYSAITDSDDLAALIRTLHLGKVYLIGHSYGALTSLFLMARHPEMVRAAVLAEPPAMNLLLHLPRAEASAGRKMYDDVMEHMEEPMKRAFSQHDTEKGVAIFMNYVFRDPEAWRKMSPAEKAEALKGAHEWEIMLPDGTLFPAIRPQAVKAITTPVLLMSGARSYPFLGMIDLALQNLLPDCQRIVFNDSGHQMWLQHPDQARAAAERFFAAHP